MTSPEDSTLPDNPIQRDEILARAITTSKEADKARNGQVPASVFTYFGQATLSVNRLEKMTRDEARDQGRNIAAARGANRTFYGWATLAASDVMAAGCQIAPAPETNNPWHAHIVMPQEASIDKDFHREIAAELALCAVWLSADSSIPSRQQ